MRHGDDFAKRFIEAITELDSIRLSPIEQLTSVRLDRIGRILDRVDEQAIRAFEDDGIKTSDDVRTLALLRSAGVAGLTNTQLKHELGGSKAGVSSRLNRLAKHRIITRQTTNGDQRFQINVLTESGREIADAAVTALFNERGRIFAALDETQLTSLATMLGDLIQEIGPDD